MDAQEIAKAIGEGVAKALSTNQFFLGIEEDAFKNADIHPEYVTTVEVAKKLTAPDRVVSLETHMKELRQHARSLAWMRNRNEVALAGIDSTLSRYRFGKKDSQRLDILVRRSDTLEPPLLIAEAKLGIDNLSGVIQDIDRVVRLFTMYNDLQLLNGHNIYGAVLFHFMEEGNDTGALNPKGQKLLAGINAHLDILRQTKPWLNCRAGMLTHGATIQPVTGYREVYDDGYEEDVFAKHSFTFLPGLVLLSNATDVNSAQF
jgi:hypothetical protein